MAIDTLTNDKYTIKEHHVQTEDKLHTLYVQEWGNPRGIKVLFLHGGPGVGCNDKHKNYFDPKRHHVIFVDQRGSGLSTPYGSLEGNTTDYLAEDLELVRKKLKIDKWVLFGGSWGSTLALCYGIKHSGMVSAMVLYGIFLGTSEEIDWIKKGKYKDFFPEVWERYLEQSKNSKSIDVYAYTTAMGSILKLDDRSSIVPPEGFDASPFNIELHYMENDCFLPQDYIINNIHKLTMPIHIIQGRYDMLCPPITAHNLHESLPNSTLQMTLAGHSGSDRSSFDAIKATMLTLCP